MKRPSFYVLVCTAVVTATFMVRGDLAVGAQAATKREPGPVVVKLDAPVRLPAPHALLGSVIDTMGFFVAGAEVRSGAAQGRTDADGHFRLDVRPNNAAPLSVRIAASGYRDHRLPAFPLAQEPMFIALEPSAPWDVPVPEAPTAAAVIGEGIVRSEDSKPVANALVIVAETGALARTDATGRYSIALAPSQSTLIVQAAESSVAVNGLAGRSEPVPTPAGRARTPLEDLVVHPAGALRGTVRSHDGQPLRGVPLFLTGNGLHRSMATGDSGSFRIAGLAPGHYELRTSAFRGALGASTRVLLDRPVVDCELHLAAASEKRVQVVTEFGAPVARAMVETRVAGLRCGVDRADDKGWVQVRASDNAAEYEVRNPEDYAPLRVVASVAADRIVVARP